MGLVETEGLVLKNYSLSDADKIVVFLTREHGLIRGVAKGAKRLKSHFGGSLEPFSIVRFSYFQKDQQELVSIRQSDLVESFFDKASDPLFLQRFAYMAELLGEFAPPGEPNQRLFNMTRICIETDAPGTEALDAMLLYFELWLLKLGGYLPNWDSCDDCGKEVVEGDEVALQANFHLMCRSCQKAKGAWLIGFDERMVYNSAQKMAPQKFIEEVSGKPEAVRNVSTVLKRIIAGILGRDWHEDKILSAIYK